MKRFMLLMAMILVGFQGLAQDKLYLTVELMKVDNEQEGAYWQTEKFWEKIHEQRIKNGDIIGWDLWRLQPGGEDQHYQYMTVNLYDDPVKMMSGEGDFNAALEAAYPDMSKEERQKHFNNTSKSRDLAVRLFLERIDHTDDNFEMPIGTVASINFMKVAPGNNGKYEKMESEVFKPMHQESVKNGARASWGLLRIIAPYGSDTYASHITVDMYKDYNQLFNPPSSDNNNELSDEQMKKINEGLATRDMRYAYMATLIRKQR